jgi:hypothetical protein
MECSFPRTEVGGVSMPRLICGTNWLLGYSHTSRAKDLFLRDLFDTPDKIADVIEVFARAGCNAVLGGWSDTLATALREVEQRTGQRMIWITTPGNDDHAGLDSWKAIIDQAREMGATFCFPHTCITDARLDRINRRLTPVLIAILKLIRDAGMVPGLSTHTPEAIICSDECGADVETYIQPYNAAGFMCQVETDWLQRVFHNAKKPVMTIKPLAAGRLMPPTGLAFVWNTLRDCDMVTVGTQSVYEAEEVIELSLANLERRTADVELQFTRSKQSLATAPRYLRPVK